MFMKGQLGSIIDLTGKISADAIQFCSCVGKAAMKIHKQMGMPVF